MRSGCQKPTSFLEGSDLPSPLDLDALAAEFNEAEKAATGEDSAETEEDTAKALADDDKLAPNGSICEVKEIYDTKTSNCGCCPEWVDEKPGRDHTEEHKAAENRRLQFSVIRRLTPHGAGRWKTHSILINSRRIQAAMAKVFEGYPVTYADDHDLELTPKFIPFCHRWEKLLEVGRDEPDAEIKRHLDLLGLLWRLNSPIVLSGAVSWHARDSRLSSI
ncbi:hypothetical protein FJTKL_08764 [Diaporthe vaccinii]|uniref:Uncharacterized protein n=1 Tax=Diaporthe vaccinii TaxID=105482 RepID=A0ABR4EQF7_9PEZI